MLALAWIAFARAHPPGGSLLAPDAHEQLADEIVLGPPGCFAADAAIGWDHRSGGFAASGTAATTWRFDDQAWSVERWDRDPPDDAGAGPDDVRIAPLLLGVAVHADLRYPTTPNRVIDWPAPSAPLPRRLFGEIESVSLDTLDDGATRVVHAFDWDGWKRVRGERRVRYGGDGPTVVELDAVDRWPNGCSVRSIGTATLGPRGLPVTEIWRFEGNCPLRDWSAEWTFAFSDWERCGAAERP
jgi:hypothetical protein